jgi:hypothetical protein
VARESRRDAREIHTRARAASSLSTLGMRGAGR